MDTPVMAYLIVHTVVGLLVAYLAQRWKGRSFGMWFIIGFLIQFLGLIILCFMPKMVQPSVDN